MKLLSRLPAGIAVGVFVSACAGSGPEVPDTAAARVPQQGNWFCQMSASGQGWDCVQDRELAGDPQPDRLPAPSPPPEPMTPPDPAPLPTGSPADGPAAAPRFDDDDALPADSDTVPPEPAPPGASGRPAAEADPAGLSGAAPEHVRLAYRPDGPVALTDLPEDFYAVQLLAMSSKEALESFVAREQISGMSAARVERDGELYFVLLLGIYETADIARQAVAALPPEIGGAEPWIRPLGSLQSAMLRADGLAGAQRF